MNRAEMLARVRERATPWDIAIIGGGATGAGIAVDAAARGYATVLFEQHDFGKGTSSRSTKLAHGGVRYLERGDVGLVMEALRERGLMRQNAPHIVHDRAFVVPAYDWWESPFYGVGLKIYDLLAGKYGFGPSRLLSREETIERLPNLEREGLRGGIVYYDGQFDDARLLIHLLRTAADHGAALVNYAPVTSLLPGAAGFHARDAESGETFAVPARVVINATGAFADAVRRMAEPAAQPLIAPSQGIHLVFDGSFLHSETAILVPHTSDGRVLFAIPWHGHTLVGTTDTPIPEAALEPVALEEEIEFVLKTAGDYLDRKPSRADVLSVFAGIRPLVKTKPGPTAELARDHVIRIEEPGLVTITGGKWTTYRHMAEQCVDQAAELAGLEHRPSPTREMRIHGYLPGAAGDLAVYGTDAAEIEPGPRLAAALPYGEGEVRFAARREMARTVEDVLARRTRALCLNARAAIAMAPRVAEILAEELGRDAAWREAQVREFGVLARGYCLGDR